MNKVDAFGVMASLLLVWLFSLYLLPFTVRMIVYASIAAWSVGRFIGRVPMMLSKKTERDFLNDMFDVADNQNKSIAEMLQCLKIAAVANRSLLARIDELMFEYCPEDMTPQQIANYEAHQRAVNEPLH